MGWHARLVVVEGGGGCQEISPTYPPLTYSHFLLFINTTSSLHTRGWQVRKKFKREIEIVC